MADDRIRHRTVPQKFQGPGIWGSLTHIPAVNQALQFFPFLYPAMFMQIIPAVPPTWMFAVPFLNVMLVLRGMLMNTLPPTAIIFTLTSMFVFLMLALRFAARGFGSEKALLNKMQLTWSV